MMQVKSTKICNAINIAWFVLVAATGIGWWLGYANQTEAQNVRLATAGIIIVAFIKVWIVGFQFMELRHAPRWLEHGYNAWAFVVSAALIIICLI